MKRIYRNWEKWECYRAGFYSTTSKEKNPKEEYAKFLSDLPRFESALSKVIHSWPHSCEHFLSNESINRLAWLGQAAMCIDTGVPSCFRGGYGLLPKKQQEEANMMADKYLQIWIKKIGNETAIEGVRKGLAQQGLF